MVAKVLIVDDSARFRAAAAELLADRGLQVFGSAADGDEAVALTADSCPDGVLVDVNLAGVDGFAVAAALADACPGAVIVMTSANVDRVPPDLLGTCGASAFVSKEELAGRDLVAVFSPADT